MPFQSSWPAEERATDQRRQRAARSGPGAAPTGRCAAALGPSATRISAERRWPWEKLLAGIPCSAQAWTNPAPLMSNFSSAAASSQGGRGSQPHIAASAISADLQAQHGCRSRSSSWSTRPGRSCAPTHPHQGPFAAVQHLLGCRPAFQHCTSTAGTTHRQDSHKLLPCTTASEANRVCTPLLLSCFTPQTTELSFPFGACSTHTAVPAALCSPHFSKATPGPRGQPAAIPAAMEHALILTSLQPGSTIYSSDFVFMKAETKGNYCG